MSQRFGLNHDDWGRLVLIDSEGVRHVGVEPVRAFPLSEPQRWIALLDANGHELVLITDLDTLTPENRQALEEELRRREFVPVLRRIVRISSDSPPCEWDVETDRGPTRFTLDSEDQIRRLGSERVLITDTRGLRYLIPDIRALDPQSRLRLERYL